MPTLSNMIGLGLSAAAGGLVVYLINRRNKKLPAPKDVELTYFDIKAHPGEKVRLALVLNGINFTDNRIKFPDFTALKPTLKYGQLPKLCVDGVEQFQSGAMLRWVGRMGNGSLYPVDDLETFIKIEEMLNLSDDLQRAWLPSLYLGMGRHEKYGYPKEWKEKDETIKRVRTAFIADELPKFMAFLSAQLEETGAFLAGAKPTIADCLWLPQVKYFASGIADHVPKDCLDKYAAVLAWIERMHAIPELKKWYVL